MVTSKRIRLFGGIAALLLLAFACLQFLPETSAQKEDRKIVEVDRSDAVSSDKPADNFNAILLTAKTIDVKTEELEKASNDRFDGKRLHLVRFKGPIQGRWVEMLESTGAEIVNYVPHYTYIVFADSNALQRIRSEARNVQSPIEWEGNYRDEYKIMPKVFENGKAGRRGGDPITDRVQVQLFKNKGTNDETMALIGRIKTTDVTFEQDVLKYYSFVVGVDKNGIEAIASRPDVISIHPWIEPRKFDERQNLILRGNLTGNAPTAGNYLDYLLGKGFTQAQFQASNFAVDLTDSGVDGANPAAPTQFLLRTAGDPAGTSRFLYSRLEGTPNGGSTLAGCDGHGNINASIIGGYVPSGGIFAAFPHADAQGFRYGLGVNPFVKIGSSVIFDPNSFTNPNLPNLQSKAYQDGARISSNSWGSAAGGAYTATSQTFDALVRDAQPTGSTNATAGNQEMVIVFAAGNDGSGANTMGAPGTSKNVITVGASENVHPFGGPDFCNIADTGADNAFDIIGFSSRGPNDDGRVKPDIMLPGTHVTGGAAQASNVSPVAGNGVASPCFLADGEGVCGGPQPSNFFPLGQQWYTASGGTSHSTPAISGYAALIRQHFINQSLTPPSPAMTKALMMNTAEYMNGVGANDNLPSNNQGMGLADMDRYFSIFEQGHVVFDQGAAETFTNTGQERTITGTIEDPAKPFRVTVAWSDAPGATSGNAFVNNLDLEVIAGGNTYLGNNFLQGVSQTGGTADVRNNAESVWLPPGTSGTFVVKIKATNIAGDGLPGNADTTDQDYALVVLNGEEVPAPVVSAGSTAITAESCQINNAIDPGETVTIDFQLSNVGTAPTTNLTATLLSTGGVTNPSGAQNYGALAAGGGSATRPFTFTASTDCGEILTASFQLNDGAADLGIVTFRFDTGVVSGVGGPQLETSGDIAVAIPLTPASVEIPINVTGNAVISDLNVGVRLDHTFVSDLTVTLVSPAGTAVTLFNQRGGSGDNMGSGANSCSGTKTVFDDSAATAIGGGAPPFAGSFKPESLLSAFNGERIEGQWILRVADGFNLDGGTVGCVELDFTRNPFICCGVAGEPDIVSGGQPVITNESFTPDNDTPDPGETVTIDVNFGNAGTGPTSNLIATLQNSGGVTPVTTSQSYGALAPGSNATRSFSFVANGTCGDTITATFILTDGATNHGTFTYDFRLGTIVTQESSFSNTAPITIGTGAGAPGSPYPSAVSVTGAPAQISGAKVTLHGYSHTFPGDVDVLLVSPTGRKFIMMSDAGSTFASAVSGVTWVFEDAGAATLPSSWSTPPTGPFKPTNHTSGDAFAAPAPAGPYLSPGPAGTETFASAFGGAAGGDPNGTWNLFVVDDATGDGGGFSGGWTLTLLSTSNVCSTGGGPGGPSAGIRADFDGDDKTDPSVYRASEGNWYVKGSQNGIVGANWGVPGDVPFAGDFSGDGRTDLVVRRHVGDGSTPDFHIFKTDTNTYEGFSWGIATDKMVVGDWDDDGIDEVAAFRAHDQAWYIRDGIGEYRVVLFGASSDTPFTGDFDGDGRADLALWRPVTGEFFYASQSGGSFSNFNAVSWGVATDIPVVADYDGDNKDDIAVYRPSDGVWYIVQSSNGQFRFDSWGVSTDVPVPGDYDGDGHYDPAVFRDGTWYIKGSQAGIMVDFWGVGSDTPIPRLYLP